MTTSRLSIRLAALTLALLSAAIAQTSDYVFYRNFVRHADATSCTHTPPTAGFVAFLNRDSSTILIENAPRWNPSGGPNIPGDGTFGVEFGNFAGPTVQAGDSVFVEFTCRATQQQGIVGDSVTAIPWFYFPVYLNLSTPPMPNAPENVALTIDTVTNYRTVSWTGAGGVTYTVYRRSVQDTLANGRSRMVYTRLSRNIVSNNYVDSSAQVGMNYGYIVFAVSPTGIMSAHSEEANELAGRIAGLAVTPRATTATLSWRPFTSPGGNPKGYNIYRRTSGGIYGNPVAYDGLDTTFIDSRLSMGTTYYYKVKARFDEFTEIASSDEIQITTLPSRAGLCTYATLRVAVPIYQNTTHGGISDADVVKIKTMLDVGKLFYWRNSGLKLNVAFTYFPITDLRDFGDPNNMNVEQTVADLDSLGVMNTQYDIVFRVTPATAGYWSYGVIPLGLPGPSRETGFSQSEWPVGTGVIYPGTLPGINYGLTWIFVHECQHAIDDLYRVNAHPEMYHGDTPWLFPVPCGEQYDFQAKIFRTFTEYEDLFPNWGAVYEAVDADQDGFPDAEPLVALDEARFGSNPSLVDTDGDGLSDKAEATNGTYTGSNPLATDTDGDGVPDGQDLYPRYPLNRVIPRFTPVIDGVIEPAWTLMNDTVVFTQAGYSPRWYMAYDPDSLYVALYLPNIGIPQIDFDFETDGFWWGAGNTDIGINISTGTFTAFHSRDASTEARQYFPAGEWDDDPNYQTRFNRRIIDPQHVHLVVRLTSPVVQIEMAIPRSTLAGLLLNPGDSIAAYINYTRVNNQPSQWASTFDQYGYARFVLEGQSDVREPKSIPTDFQLEQNFPNPFNPGTTIRFGVPRSSMVSLEVYNELGQKIRTLVHGEREPGNYSVVWDGRSDSGVPVANGLYFYRLQSASGIQLVRKMLMVR